MITADSEVYFNKYKVSIHSCLFLTWPALNRFDGISWQWSRIKKPSEGKHMGVHRIFHKMQEKTSMYETAKQKIFTEANLFMQNLHYSCEPS